MTKLKKEIDYLVYFLMGGFKMTFFEFRDEMLIILKEIRIMTYKIALEIYESGNSNLDNYIVLEIILKSKVVVNAQRASIMMAQTVPYFDASLRIMQDIFNLFRMLLSIEYRILELKHYNTYLDLLNTYAQLINNIVNNGNFYIYKTISNINYDSSLPAPYKYFEETTEPEFNEIFQNAKKNFESGNMDCYFWMELEKEKV